MKKYVSLLMRPTLAFTILSVTFFLVAGLALADSGALLRKAAMNGDVSRVRALLDSGTDVNAQGEGGYTALSNAASNGHVSIVKLLIERGADLDQALFYSEDLDQWWRTKENVVSPGLQTAIRLLRKFRAEREEAKRQEQETARIQALEAQRSQQMKEMLKEMVAATSKGQPTTAVIALPAVSPQSGSFAAEKKSKPEIKTVDNYVAIFDFEVRDKDKDISRPLADKVIHEFSQSGKYEVIDRGNMNKILGEQKFQMSGCVAQECKVEAGQILGVGKIVNGSVGMVGKVYYLTLQLIDVKTGKVELSAEDECRCELEELLGSTTRLAKKLLGEKVEQPAAIVQKPATAAIAPPAAPAKETARDGRFIAYDNGTVSDTRTNLMWAAKDNGAGINWQDAKKYCENYRGGGYTDWRMPTLDELAGLYDTAKTYKSACGYDVHSTELIRLTCVAPWASETRGSVAAQFDLNGGGRYWFPPTTGPIYRALPVRSGK